MPKNIKPTCIPNTNTKTDLTDCLSTASQTVSRHINYTNASQEVILNGLRHQKYSKCGVGLKVLLAGVDNSNTPRSCQFEYIKFFGRKFIETCSWMFDLYEEDIFHITIVCDEWNQSEDSPEFNVKKSRDRVIGFVKRYLPEFSAVGFVEFQRIEARKEDGNVGLIAMHYHLIVYGGELENKRRENIRKRCRLFRSTLTNNPIFFQRVTRTNNDKHRIFSYLIKHPTKKLILKQGKKKTKAEKRPISIQQHMRILEVLSYIPLESRVFGVGHGCMIRNEVLSSLVDRKSQFEDPEYNFDEESIQKLWESYWKARREKDFKHPVIHL